MAFKIVLKLKPNSPPHLYVDKLKDFFKDTKVISERTRKTLILLKKTRMPYIPLPARKELVFAPKKCLHFERSLEPVGGYARLEWTETEIEDYKKDPKAFIKQVLEMYIKMGYEFFNQENVDDKKIEELIKLTTKAK